VAPHPSLLVLDISQGSRAFAQRAGLITVKTWFPRVQHVVADGQGVVKYSCFERFGSLAFAVSNSKLIDRTPERDTPSVKLDLRDLQASSSPRPVI